MSSSVVCDVALRSGVSWSILLTSCSTSKACPETLKLIFFYVFLAFLICVFQSRVLVSHYVLFRP